MMTLPTIVVPSIRLPEWRRPSWWPGNDEAEPVVATAPTAKIRELRSLVVVSRRAADLCGAFSLFALISVLVLAAGAKQLPIPIASLIEADTVWLTVYIPWVIPFIVGAVGLWVMNRHWLKMALALRFGIAPWSKVFVILVGVIIAGAVITLATKLQDTGRVADAREGAIAEQKLDAGHAKIEAQLADAKDEIARLTGEGVERPTMQMMAAREGTIGWQERINIARAQKAPNLEAIERAMSSAKAVEALKEKRVDLQAQLASAPVKAQVSKDVQVDRGAIEWTTELFKVVPLWLALAIEFIALTAKFIEMVFQRLLNEAEDIPSAAPLVAQAAEEPPPAEPADNVIILADWRTEASDQGLTDEYGRKVKPVKTHVRRVGREAA
jgi:hypothetical protein